MKGRKIIEQLFLLLLFFQFSTFAAAEKNSDALWFFVLVKSSNYSQNKTGELSLLNYHFFSELFAKEKGAIKSASLERLGDKPAVFHYIDRGQTFYFEGGHFKSVEAVDEKHPNGDYRFDITFTSGMQLSANLKLAGPGGKTDIPKPIHISFFQSHKQIKPDQVNAELPLVVRWSPYSNGRSDPKGIVDDMIFVVFQDCHGKRIFHTGLPFKESNYMTYDVKQTIVPAGHFQTGQSYSMFVEFPHVVESTVVNGIPGFSSYATATYADISVPGKQTGDCPDKVPPLDTGQTDRMDIEIR